MAMNSDFVNESNQAERREVLKNDQAQTYFERQQNEEGPGGRFGRLPKAKVVGTTPSAVPRQGPDSPWSQGHLTNHEEPLGYNIHKAPEID
jgi:hypothetical protein